MCTRRISVYCRRDGRLEFGPGCPHEALPIATGPEEDLRGVVEVLADQGRDGALRVPGMASPAGDTDNSNALMRAFWAFQDEVEAALGARKEVAHAETEARD